MINVTGYVVGSIAAPVRGLVAARPGHPRADLAAMLRLLRGAYPRLSVGVERKRFQRARDALSLLCGSHVAVLPRCPLLCHPGVVFDAGRVFAGGFASATAAGEYL